MLHNIRLNSELDDVNVKDAAESDVLGSGADVDVGSGSLSFIKPNEVVRFKIGAGVDGMDELGVSEGFLNDQSAGEEKDRLLAWPGLLGVSSPRC